MSKLTLILLFIVSTAYGFETSSGTYISQQDVMILLKDIFYGTNVVGTFQKYELRDCAAYKIGLSRAKNFYELGFANLESGEKMVQEPDLSYVLFLDNCIGKLVKIRLSEYDNKGVTFLLGEDISSELEKLRLKFRQDNAGYTAVGGSNMPEFASMGNLGEKFFNQLEIAILSESTKDKMIQRIFLNVFGREGLIPKEYYLESRAEILDLKPTTKLKPFIELIFKKAIINDDLLKY